MAHLLSSEGETSYTSYKPNGAMYIDTERAVRDVEQTMESAKLYLDNKSLEKENTELKQTNAELNRTVAELMACCSKCKKDEQANTTVQPVVQSTPEHVYSDPIPYDPPPPPIPDWTGSYVEPRTSVTKTLREFMYGINEISMSSIKYNKNAVIVTKPVISDIDVRELSIEVSEIHPILDNDFNAIDRATSIEYYLIVGGVQFNIMPLNHDKIENELLFFDKSIATLRFKPDLLHEINVYKDGVLVDNKDILIIRGGEGIDILNYDSSSTYTASYYPLINDNYNPKIIKLSNDFIKLFLVNIDEEFDGADYNMRVQLSHTPYIDTKLIESASFDANTSLHPVEVYFTNTDFKDSNNNLVKNIYQDSTKSIYLKNVTDYKGKLAKTLQSFDARQHPVIEFYHTGNEIQFNEMFKYSEIYNNMLYGSNGNAKIHVKYQYPKLDVRLKVILRRTSDKYDEYLTPRLNEISLLAKFIK